MTNTDRRSGVETIVSTDGEAGFADFFNRVAYFQYHAKNAKGFYFRLMEKETHKPLSVMHCTEKEPGLFVSPLRATYGGIDTVEPDIELYDAFLDDVETTLKAEDAKKLRISPAPFAHDPDRSSKLFNTLIRRGFGIVKTDINYDLKVDDTPLIDKMERNNQKRVRKCIREGCVFEHCTTPDEFERVYAVIKTNRESKGYPVTMNFEHMMEMKKLFPDVWQFFATKLNNDMIAASVCIRINPEILYVFYWGDLPEAHAMSPVAFHASNLYGYCQKENVKILDIGTATDDGVPNVGLMTFKERLGCKASLKLVLEKNL